jgi:ABC-2 type transport system permease protein
VTKVLEAARQGFVGPVTWADTWPGLVALAGLLAVFGALALREMRRTNR